MWWRDEHIARDLRSGDVGARRMILTLLHSHRQELDGFVTRHPTFFFRAMTELIQRYEEKYEVKRKAWSVLTALVNLHSKIHVQQLLFEHGVFGLALKTLGGAYGQDQGCCCVNEVLEFLLALKNDNIRLFDLDAHVVQRLTALPMRLGQGIDRFGYKLLIQLLRDLQVTEGGAYTESVDQHTVELVDCAGPTTFLILVERILEECRSYFAPHDAKTTSVISHSHPDWPGLSSWHLGALLAEIVKVLRPTQGNRAIASFDRVIALKWLQMNSAAITTQFQEPHDLSEVLGNAVSDNRNTHVVQGLAVDLGDALATQRTSLVAPTAVGRQVAARAPSAIATRHLSTEIQDAVHKLQHGTLEQKVQAINYFTSYSNAMLTDEDSMRNDLHVISTALRVLADPSTPESTKEQIWEMLATVVTETPSGTSVICAQEYYELVCAALQVLVDDAEMSEASGCAPWTEALLVGPLHGICVDEVDRNGSSWRTKSPYAGAVITTLLIHQLEQGHGQKPDGTERIWDLLGQNLEIANFEAVSQVIVHSKVLAIAAHTAEASNHFGQVNIPVLGFVRVLIRKQALPATMCSEWIRIALQLTVSTVDDPPSREFLVQFLKESVTNYPECEREIEIAVPNLVQDAAEKRSTPIEFVELLISSRRPQSSLSIPLQIPRVVHLLTKGNVFEKLVLLKHLESFSVPEYQEFFSSFSGLAVLHHLVLHGKDSQPASVKKIMTKMAQSDFYCRAQIAEFQLHNSDAAFISREDISLIYGNVPVELAKFCRKLMSASPSAESQDILRRQVTNILRLHEQAYSLSESEALTQMVLRVLQLDSTFQYHEQAFYFLHEIYRQFGSTQETLVHGIPLLTQRLSEEQNADAADSLTNLIREFAFSNHDMSSIIDQSIQRIMDENDSNNGVIYYQNLLAVYRKRDGMTLGKPHGRREIPNLTVTIDVLSTGHALEKLVALALLRKYIPILPATSLPPLLFEVVSTIFGLTIAGAPQIQPIEKEVLTEFFKRDSKCEAIVSRFQYPLTLSTAPSPWVLRYQRVPTRPNDSTLDKTSASSPEEVQETEPEDEHMMCGSDGDLRFMYSDSDGDDTIEGYGACEEDGETASAYLTAQQSTLSRS